MVERAVVVAQESELVIAAHIAAEGWGSGPDIGSRILGTSLAELRLLCP